MPSRATAVRARRLNACGIRFQASVGAARSNSSMLSGHSVPSLPLSVQPPATINVLPTATMSCDERGTGSGGRACHWRVTGSISQLGHRAHVLGLARLVPRLHSTRAIDLPAVGEQVHSLQRRAIRQTFPRLAVGELQPAEATGHRIGGVRMRANDVPAIDVQPSSLTAAPKLDVGSGGWRSESQPAKGSALDIPAEPGSPPRYACAVGWRALGWLPVSLAALRAARTAMRSDAVFITPRSARPRTTPRACAGAAL